MRFEMDGKEYRLRFRHTDRADGSTVTEFELLEGRVVTWGIEQQPTKRFCKATGRELALGRALDKLWSRREDMSLAAAAGLAYHERKWLAERKRPARVRVDLPESPDDVLGPTASVEE